jgi:hypothetical protein
MWHANMDKHMKKNPLSFIFFYICIHLVSLSSFSQPQRRVVGE